MVAQKYGRVVMKTSSSGLYGNFGQSDYGAAKLALVGLMQSLALEGARHDIRVNCLAPTAATRKTEGLMPQQVLRALEPQAVSPPMLVLASDSAPNRAVLCARETAGAPARLTGGPGLACGTLVGPGPRYILEGSAVGCDRRVRPGTARLTVWCDRFEGLHGMCQACSASAMLTGLRLRAP